MCNICYAHENDISCISSSPATMCDVHYSDWFQEKSIGENW